MISLEAARERVLGGCRLLVPRRVPLADALGLVMAEDIVATELIPPFVNTAVDGFAVRAADTVGATPESPISLVVVGTVAAGAVPTMALAAGQAMRAMTGAPLPEAADAMVMVEDTEALLDGDEVLVRRAAKVGDNLRAAGGDVRPGDRVLMERMVITPAHLGVLASLGHLDVLVYPRPRVGVLSTGDELMEGPAPLGPGQIRDSNRRALLSLVAVAGCEAVDLGLIRDDEQLIAEAFEQGATTCDAVISSGGVSMGDFDFVKRVLDRADEINWMQIAIRPAKPMAFGHMGSTPIFGLPGNPVSTMVSFELLARPALRQMAGHTVLDRPRFVATALEAFPRSSDGKTHFARVSAVFGDGRFTVRSSGGQGSHQLTAMAAANALAILPDGPGTEAGAEVEILLFGTAESLLESR